MADSSTELVDKAFEQFKTPLLRYLYTLIGNASESEDLMQESFLRLNQELRSGVPVENVKAWLFRAAHNLAMDSHRRRARSAANALDGPAMDVPDQRRLSPEVLVLRERSALLRAAMSQLSEQQRLCLRLRADGLRYREIADVLGVSEGTVCEHLKRGLTRLRINLRKASL